jgi:hypothetical protein
MSPVCLALFDSETVITVDVLIVEKGLSGKKSVVGNCTLAGLAFGKP